MIFIPFSWILYREKARGTGGAPPRGNMPQLPTYNKRYKTSIYSYKSTYLTTRETPYGGTPPYHGGLPPPRGWDKIGKKRQKKLPFNNSPIRDKIGHFLPNFCPFFATFLPLFATKCHKMAHLGQKNATKRHKRA